MFACVVVESQADKEKCSKLCQASVGWRVLCLKRVLGRHGVHSLNTEASSGATDRYRLMLATPKSVNCPEYVSFMSFSTVVIIFISVVVLLK